MAFFLSVAINATVAPVSYAQSSPHPGRLALPNNFTLVYHVVRQDLRSGAMKQTAQALQTENTKWNVASGQITEEEGKKIDNLVNKQNGTSQPLSTFTLTVSGNDGALFYKKQEGKRVAVSFYNPQSNTTLALDAMKGAALYSGLETGAMEGIPLPGVGLGPIPLFKDQSSTSMLGTQPGHIQQIIGQSPSVYPNGFSGGRGMLYFSSTANILDGTLPKTLNCVLYINGQTEERWDYSDHKYALGCWLPQHIVYTVYADADGGSMEPGTSYTYTFVSASPTSLPNQMFTPEGILPDRTYFQSRVSGDSIAFFYKTSGVSFMKQMDEARWKQKIQETEIEEGQTKHSYASRLLVMSAIGCAGLAWFIWRRRFQG